MKRFEIPALAVLAGLLALAGSDSAAQDRAVDLANPAAVYCVESGGTYAILQSADGATGTCTLADGTVRDAWEYFRENNQQ